MLKITIVLNTAMEEIFSKKCCGYHDMNLEIQLRNEGDSTLSIPSYCDLVNDSETERIDYLFPHGKHILEPGRQMSFYCYIDENRLLEFENLVVHDDSGSTHRAKIQT